MRHEQPNPGDAYQTDDDPPTLTYCVADTILALPYHLVRSMQLGKDETRVEVAYDDYTAMIIGTNLGRLWRELRVYRVREIVVNGGAPAKALGSESGRCLVEGINVRRREGAEPEE